MQRKQWTMLGRHHRWDFFCWDSFNRLSVDSQFALGSVTHQNVTSMSASQLGYLSDSDNISGSGAKEDRWIEELLLYDFENERFWRLVLNFIRVVLGSLDANISVCHNSVCPNPFPIIASQLLFSQNMD